MALKRKKPVRLLLILVLTLLIVLSLLSARVTSETYSQLHHLHIGSGLGDRFFDIIHEWSSSSAKTNTIANVSNRDVINVPPQEKTKTSLDERDSAKKTAPAGKARAERFPWFVNESSRHPEAVHHVVFVKVGLTLVLVASCLAGSLLLFYVQSCVIYVKLRPFLSRSLSVYYYYYYCCCCCCCCCCCYYYYYYIAPFNRNGWLAVKHQLTYLLPPPPPPTTTAAAAATTNRYNQ